MKAHASISGKKLGRWLLIRGPTLLPLDSEPVFLPRKVNNLGYKAGVKKGMYFKNYI